MWQTGLRDFARYGKRTFKTALGRDSLYCLDARVEYVRVGNPGAEWAVDPQALGPHKVMYSFGVGEDVSADLALIDMFGLLVHAFDPTPKSIAWVAGQVLPAEFQFHPYGVADYDGVAEFTPPNNQSHVSHTMLRRQTLHRSPVQAPVKRLATIMRELGHRDLDILKMDIEGAEYGVLSDLLASGLRPHQLLLEFHHGWPEVGIAKTKSAVAALRRAGFSLFYVSPTGQEFGFRFRRTD